ncbi:predicted protein [Arabidopsis lyrata subsp. lyrata]|uniref:Predicted protein n=1 Tax=Arabidopsis lyrata subsp. lyrata TaxID=81972 RepID=D7KMY8_ARALL|nr:predicted protein [Arabidopsis lyrata subsp. lyrata]
MNLYVSRAKIPLKRELRFLRFSFSNLRVILGSRLRQFASKVLRASNRGTEQGFSGLIESHVSDMIFALSLCYHQPESAMVNYIVKQYVVAIEGDTTLVAVESMYVIGKVIENTKVMIVSIEE